MKDTFGVRLLSGVETAAGLCIDRRGTRVFALQGSPEEMQASHFLPESKSRSIGMHYE